MTNENRGTVLKVAIITEGDRKELFPGNRTRISDMSAGILQMNFPWYTYICMLKVCDPASNSCEDREDLTND
ncbi:hypothetical protein AV530_016190 [Patagioenas fasciata monilis]|uniref:Uncharacterized protein n=1 Tax=Patagioenas fasciata monilis TaxID=372326 RepID=A0A1V4JWD8_PATFA|nr:hypothetical protein AV530_016190 [Patagioenas fasciata monilis]